MSVSVMMFGFCGRIKTVRISDIKRAPKWAEKRADALRSISLFLVLFMKALLGGMRLDECSWGYMSTESNYWFAFQFYIIGYRNTSVPTEVMVTTLSLPTTDAHCVSGYGGYQWGETTEVTSINLKVHDSAAEFAQNSTVRLYGIKHTV